MYKQKILNKLVPCAVFGPMLSVTSAFGVYTPTNGANAGYVVTEISADVYNQAILQSDAPVFVVFQNDSTPIYYKYTLPNLTIYKNDYTHESALTGPTIYTDNITEPIGNFGYLVYRDIDENGTVFWQKYTKNISAGAGGYWSTNIDGPNVSGNFFYVTGNGAVHVTDIIDPQVTIAANFIGNNNVSHGGGAIRTDQNANIASIEGVFIFNYNNGSISSGLPGGGAIYLMGGSIDNIAANFIGNYSSRAGGAIYNSGTIDSITGDFVYNFARGSSGAGQGAAIYNGGTIGTITGDFIANGSGTAIYNIGHLTSITGNFIGNNGAIYNSGTLGIVAPGGGQIIFGTESDTIANSGTLSLSGSGDIFLHNITGGGSTYVTSSNITLAPEARITQGTLRINSGSLTASANGLKAGSTINNGTINLSTGTLTSNITGTGLTNILGEVISNATISQSINISNTSSLSIAAGHTGGTINNAGTLTLSDGTVGYAISGAGHTYITGNVNIDATVANQIHINDTGALTLSASDFGDSIQNNGQLFLTTGEIEGLKYISGTGTTTISGNVTTSASVFVGTNIVNNGQVTLTGGNLNTPICGTGTVINTGTLYVAANNVGSNITNNNQVYLSSGTLEHAILGGSITISSTDTILSLANNLGNSATTVDNSGIISLTGGTLFGHIGGTGHINITNTVSTSASNLGNAVTNNGTLNLTSGALSEEVTGSGNIVISGPVSFESSMNQDVSVATNGALSIGVSNISRDILNNGTVNLVGGGILTRTISGTGATNINSIVTSSANNLQTVANVNGTWNLTGGTVQNTISGSGAVVNTGILNSYATYLQNDNFTNNDTLNLTGGTLSKSIFGTGATNITNDVTIGANNLELQNIMLGAGSNLMVGQNTLTVQNATIDGTLQINITELLKNSSVYSGGQLNVIGDLHLGDNSALQLIINPNALNEHEQTAELNIINVSGTQYGTFGQLVANNRYSIVQENNNYIISLGLTLDDIIESNGGSANAVRAGRAWDSAIFADMSYQQILQNNLWYLSEYNASEYMKVLNNIIPIESNVAIVTAHSVNTAIMNQFTNRLNIVRNNHIGRSGGDTTYDKLGLWVEGLYNISELTSTRNIDSDTIGFTLGGEISFNDKFALGLGYTNNSTSISASPVNIDAMGHTFSVYGEYMLDKFYLDGILSLGMATYKQKTDLGNDAEYKATTVAANVMVGYRDIIADLPITPELGFRYITTTVDSYEDAVGQKINYEDVNALTVVADAKYYKTISLNLKNTSAVLIPEAKFGVIYDIMSSDYVANVDLGSTSYVINGEKLNPFGVNLGIGATVNLNHFDCGLAYDLEWRNNFVSHTGRVKVKYVF